MHFDDVLVLAFFLLIVFLIVWFSVRCMCSSVANSHRMMPRISRRIALSIVVLAATALATATFTMAQTKGSYYGRLDGNLHIDPKDISIDVWDAAEPNDAINMDVLLKSGDRLFKGRLTLGGDTLHAFDGAIVRSTDGTDALYVDTNRDGKFEDSERFVFQPFEGDSIDNRIKDRVRIVLPLLSGPYKSCEMEVLLPKQNVPTPAGPKQVTVLYTGNAFVEG